MPDIRIVTALPSEAKPINHFLNLERDQQTETYSLFRNADTTLLISGVGAKAIEDAVNWMEQRYPSTDQTRWLNIGIAGHASRPLGDMVLIDRASNERGDTLQIKTPAKPLCDTESSLTVTEPLPDYPDKRVYDMECFSFFHSLRHLRPGSAQALKIVSDNQDSPIEHISRQLVNNLVRGQLEKLNELINYWRIELESD